MIGAAPSAIAGAAGTILGPASTIEAAVGIIAADSLAIPASQKIAANRYKPVISSKITKNDQKPLFHKSPNRAAKGWKTVILRAEFRGRSDLYRSLPDRPFSSSQAGEAFDHLRGGSKAKRAGHETRRAIAGTAIEAQAFCFHKIPTGQ